MGFLHRSSLSSKDDVPCLPCFATEAEREIDVEEEQRRAIERRRSKAKARRSLIKFLNDDSFQFFIFLGILIVVVPIMVAACVIRDQR